MTTTLYCPVGQAEYDLIAASGFREFPPRLSHQPIFYPVTNEAYAAQIARDWNTKDAASGFAGDEYWIPATDLDDFNAAIVGQIEIVAEFRP